MAADRGCLRRLEPDPALILPVPAPTLTKPTTLALPIPANTPAGIEIFLRWALCESGSCRGSQGMKLVTR